MSIIITPEIINYINNLLNKKLKILLNDINYKYNLNITDNDINKYINISLLYKYKYNTSLISEENQCLAINSSNKRCTKEKVENSKYCIKHINKINNRDYIDKQNVTKSVNNTDNYKINGEIICINDKKYIYIKYNNLLFSHDLYNIQYIGKYINNEILYN